MKIDSLTLYHIRNPLVTPFETSFGRIGHKECILVELHAGGLNGFGESAVERDTGYNYETIGTAWHILKDFVAPRLLGKDPCRRSCLFSGSRLNMRNSASEM